jgi:hypothetical protein
VLKNSASEIREKYSFSTESKRALLIQLSASLESLLRQNWRIPLIPDFFNIRRKRTLAGA